MATTTSVMDERFEALRRTWYANPNIQYNIIDTLKYRECVLLREGCVHRCIKANAVRFLAMNWERYHFFKEPFNMYGSLAHYPALPMFSFNRTDKRKEMDTFNDEYMKYIKGYDFLIDIDNPKIGIALKSLLNIRKLLRDYNVPYWVIFSGTKGFHIRIDYEDMPDAVKSLPWLKLAEVYRTLAERIRFFEGAYDIDVSVFDLRRIAKTPYSVVYPYYFVAYPLTDDDIDNFSLENMSIITLLPKVGNMRNRNKQKRCGTPEGVLNLLKRYEVKL